jgi:uncharacterized protein (DUF2141 family)
MSVLNKILTAAALLMLYSCAAVNPPEGGPKDEKKPDLKKSTPTNGSTGFSGRTIILEFNEDVITKDLNKELIISPNTGNSYTIKNDREKIELTFDKALEENTTYRLNFNQGIVDITEGNKAENVSLSFSTGSFIDSASISGKVINYLTTSPESNLTVALYPESDTNNIRDHKPYYFTRSAADGSFQLNNIKSGAYWVFALNDKNNNEFFDQEKEKIAYLPKPVTVQTRQDSVILKTVYLDTKKPFILSTENNLDQNTLVFNEGITSLNFKSLDKTGTAIKLPLVVSEDGKRTTVFPVNGALPAQLIVLSTDSTGNQGLDTAKFVLSGKKAIAEKISFSSKTTQLAPRSQNLIELNFPVPINIKGKQPFTILEDTIRKIIPEFPKDYSFNETNTVLKLKYTTKALKQVDIIPDTTTITTVNGKPIQKQKLTLDISSKGGTGSFSGTLRTTYKSYWLEILDEKGKIVKSFANPRQFKMDNMLPGTYQFRVKIDENNDGKWKTGDKLLKTMPEKLYIYPKIITVRANWDIEDLILVF